MAGESRLGDILVRLGRVHPAQIQQALLLQKVSKEKRFGEVLMAMNAIDPLALAEALRIQAEENGAGKGISIVPPSVPGDAVPGSDPAA